jgi:sulfur-carrier protein
MAIKVRFFASLAETVGRREVDVEFRDGLTVEAIWKDLTAGESLPSGILCAVNHTYCTLDQILKDSDEVAYFPPVTGG